MAHREAIRPQISSKISFQRAKTTISISHHFRKSTLVVLIIEITKSFNQLT